MEYNEIEPFQVPFEMSHGKRSHHEEVPWFTIQASRNHELNTEIQILVGRFDSFLLTIL